MRLNDGRVLPAFIGQALRGEDLTVFGDGSQTRSFCYVDDLVEGIYRLLMSDYAQPVNIGNPDEITISDFAEEIIKLTGTNQKVIYKALPVDDPKQRQPDITVARKILDWEPKISRQEGLKITYNYFKSLSKKIYTNPNTGLIMMEEIKQPHFFAHPTAVIDEGAILAKALKYGISVISCPIVPLVKTAISGKTWLFRRMWFWATM